VNLPKLKDHAVLAAWIGGLLLLGGLFWFLTQSFRANLLLRSVNQVLEENKSGVVLARPAASGELPPGAARIGHWFVSQDGGKVLVFTMIAGGVFLPCAAVLDAAGRAGEFLPLGGHSARLLGGLSPGILTMYKRRIEGAFAGRAGQ